jgi:hypothetical protein
MMKVADRFHLQVTTAFFTREEIRCILWAAFFIEEENDQCFHRRFFKWRMEVDYARLPQEKTLMYTIVGCPVTVEEQ